MTTDRTIPSDFFWRRMQSFAGLWLVVFIIFHLLTNAQAALPIGGDGTGFIHSVNAIHDMPFLPYIEIAILAFPILIHMLWGIKYLRSSEPNSYGKTGHTPYLPEYPRNHAYTWQRITSWILVVGIIAHVVHMRFIEYPTSGHDHTYMVRVTTDEGLHPLAERLGVKLYDANAVQQASWKAAWEKNPLKPGEAVAVSNSFGAAELLMVRDTFKMPLMVALYTLLVLATCFHAFNGLWTFMITWGVTLTARSQNIMRFISTFLMFAVGLLGLSAIWLTYWNLR